MLKLIVPAAIASLVALSSAWAVPVVSPMAGAKQKAPLDFVQVQVRRPMNRDGDVRRDDDRRRFTPGRRYRQAPEGWNRRGSRRPGDWRTRGCITVGPVWFCP